jgi:hypothetical protein
MVGVVRSIAFQSITIGLRRASVGSRRLAPAHAPTYGSEPVRRLEFGRTKSRED